MRRADFLDGRPTAPGELPDVSWFGADGRSANWNQDDHSLMCLLAAPAVAQTNGEPARNVLILFHAGTLPREFTLPSVVRGIHWNLFINTAAESPADIFPNLDGPPPVDGKLVLLDRSLVCYVSAPV